MRKLSLCTRFQGKKKIRNCCPFSGSANDYMVSEPIRRRFFAACYMPTRRNIP
jgi:hypothetical protein